MRLPNGVLSLLITVVCYALFFAATLNSGGDEMSDPGMAAAAAVAMTFFVNLPIAWFIIYKIIKTVRGG